MLSKCKERQKNSKILTLLFLNKIGPSVDSAEYCCVYIMQATIN